MYYLYESFDWNTYILQNIDLITDITTKKDAWDHWIKYGQYENRIMPIEKTHDKMRDIINDYVINYEEPFVFFKLNEELKQKFDQIIYLCNNPDLYVSKEITTKTEIDNHWREYGIIENRKCYDSENHNPLLKHDFLLFNWKTYVNINSDLKYFDTEEAAIKHWLKHGIKEQRATYRVNTSKIHNGRFGNLFFINMVCHFLSFKYDLIFNYKYYNKFKKLGINLFIGKNTYKKNIVLTDKNFYDILTGSNYEKTNIMVTNEMWFQSSILCNYLRYYFEQVKIRQNIINNNIFKERYNANNDLFIHLRLGDIINKIDEDCINRYYENAIAKNNFENGFISSDSINHSLCQSLIQKYRLIVVNDDEINTIMFASTCKHIILSGGTYSWLIGFFAFYAVNIYYPQIKNKWYGNIFIFPDWTAIDLLI